MVGVRMLAGAALGTGIAVALGLGSAVAADESKLRADLAALAKRRVFFGHQSVGVNLLDGLASLAAQQGVPLRIVELRPPGQGVPAETLGHAFVADNEKPLQKLQSFARSFEEGVAAGAEVALLKFCFVDITAQTDVAALFAAYQETIARLRARYPDTAFVHVTVPLMTAPGGIKASLKRLLGRPSPQLLENARRDDYNALLRRAYQGREPFFDLARLEATRPDGSAEERTWRGRSVPSLVPAFTEDGGHLVGEGQLRAARELAAVLASVPRPGK